MQYLCYATVFVALFVLRLSNAVTHNITHSKSQCDGKERASTLVDVAKDFMNKAKNLYPDCIDDDLQCGKKEKSLAFMEVASNLISEVKKTFPTCPELECPKVPDPECPKVPEPECPKVPDPECPKVPDPECPKIPEPECPKVPDPECPKVPEPECPKVPDPECPKVPEPECPKIPEPECPKIPEPECPKVFNEKPMDCSEVLQSGKNTSGVYTIWPRSRITTNKGLSVYCDMDTDGGGWTVIQRRGKFSTPMDYFYKDWKSYKIGFGDVKKEFWLGNDNIHVISNQASYTIRFDLKDTKGVTGYAQYDTFWIEDEVSQYTLHISGYNGSVGDAMIDHNKMKFSTKDRKNDILRGGSCAVERQGAGWYFDCSNANLNGLYTPGVESITGIYWKNWRNYVGLAGVDMKLRPRII